MLPSMKDPGSPYLKPKEFTKWYALDYFRRSDRLWRHWRWLLGLPIAACVAWLAVEMVTGSWRIYQAGPVSSVHSEFNDDCHAAFNDDCAKCHTIKLQTWKHFSPWHADVPTVADAACTACHATPTASAHLPEHPFPEGRRSLQGLPAPVHSEHQVGTAGCAACHREHRGRPTLQQVADGHCTTCHADLRRADDRPPEVYSPIRGFTGDQHPDFRLPDDPGTVQFNHHAHVTEGVRREGKTFVPLTCPECHQPERDGRYMKPVRYEQHCKECHSLPVQVAGVGGNDALETTAAQFRKEPAPHQEPAKVRAALQERFARFVHDHRDVLDSPAVPRFFRLMPGRTRPQAQALGEEHGVASQLETAERVLFTGPGGCRLCHPVTSPWQSGRLPVYAAAQIRPRWLQRSVFSHQSHARVDCVECHRQAPQSERTSDVLLPAIRACQQCHNAQTGPGLGARTDCTECHRYHDRRQEHLSRRMLLPERLLGAP